MENIVMFLIRVTILILSVSYCYKTASKKGLNTNLAVIMALLFNVFAVAYYRFAAVKVKKL